MLRSMVASAYHETYSRKLKESNENEQLGKAEREALSFQAMMSDLDRQFTNAKAATRHLKES